MKGDLGGIIFILFADILQFKSLHQAMRWGSEVKGIDIHTYIFMFLHNESNV